MRLFSFLKRTPGADAPPKKAGKAGARSSSSDDVQVLRVRARRRLIGAAVLVGVGVIGFPLIFETQPRPMPVDLPIEIPRKDNAPPLDVPAREAQATPPSEAQPASTTLARAPAAELPVEPAPTPEPPGKTAPKPADKSADMPVERPVEKAAEKPVDKPQDRPHDKGHDKPKPADKPVEKPTDKPASKPAAGADGARAQALLDGREPVAPATAARYIVQVGAYGENKAAQEVRNRVEKLGLKTYAQAVETPDGRRVRVRLGPFASRDEAERAAAKLKGVGLAGAILTL
ncbi:MAG: sporulation protein [Roseateles depolymerans]|uniref:Sporulation protein n=1 Tax=Roseateles depolymerans TaxID=76731 RepID=A0A2W5DDZ8_9BURK|nr:MAG: sporulation protein [Roseateles depolymerans]